MTTSLLKLRRVPETCGRGGVAVRVRRGWPGFGRPVWLGGHGAVRPGGRGQFTAVVTKSALILPCLAVAAGLAVACYAIRIPRRTS